MTACWHCARTAATRSAAPPRNGCAPRGRIARELDAGVEAAVLAAALESRRGGRTPEHAVSVEDATLTRPS
ncbi:hypothetical protein SRIMM317S_01627 [Streptomyces rimosus subsp. rimosus]